MIKKYSFLLSLAFTFVIIFIIGAMVVETTKENPAEVKYHQEVLKHRKVYPDCVLCKIGTTHYLNEEYDKSVE